MSPQTGVRDLHLGNERMEDETRQELLTLCAAWNVAIAANDVESIASFMSDDWVLVTPESGVVERSRFLGVIEAGDLSHSAMESQVLRVRIYDDSAVLTARGTNNGLFRGQPFRSDEWITDVFVKQADAWKCVLTHLTPVDGD